MLLVVAIVGRTGISESHKFVDLLGTADLSHMVTAAQNKLELSEGSGAITAQRFREISTALAALDSL